MKHFSNKLLLGGLIGCLMLSVGVYLFMRLKADKSVLNRIPREVSIPSTTKTDAKDRAIKPVATGYYKGTTVPILTEAEMAKLVQIKHTGPQTVEALMQSYHLMYLQNRIHRVTDKAYPPEPWLQSLLDKGYTILTYVEYVQLMNARAKADILDNDSRIRKREAAFLGIPESDIDRLKAAYLENYLFFLKRKHEAQRATDETIVGGFYIGDKVLPFYQDRDVVYVQRHENDTFVELLGAELNVEQRFNLIFRGIEPEGIEVIYIDKSGNRLAEKPAPVTREAVRKMMAEGEKPPPEDWWNPDTPIPDPDDFEEFLPSENTDTELDSPKWRAREEAIRQAEEAAQAELEQFIRNVRQLGKFATMSDAEVAAELEKQLRQQLLPALPTEENLEDALREMITPKPLTPERFEKAMQTLERHGPKEGLQRLAKDDPELAEYFRRNPQKVSPKRLQPSNSDDSRKE